MFSNRSRFVLAIPVAAACASALLAEQSRPAAPEKQSVLWRKLRSRIETIDRELDGVLGISVKDLRGGAVLEIHPDEPFAQASSIKLAVLYELYRQADEGKVDLEELTGPPSPRVGGGGVLELLSDGVRLTWRDMAVLMMADSDNDAANAVIDRVGMDAVNRRMDTLGLRSTRLRRRMMDLEAARRGNENVSTPAEMRRLAEIVHAGTGVSEGRGKDMAALASTPKFSAFEVPPPAGVTVTGKTGYLDAVRCWSAVVAVPNRPYSVAVMTAYLKKDADGEAAIREIATALYETFERLARSSELGRIIGN
jgi:beta-lactamase class A